MYNHGVQLTKGHLSDNGGLRGHSVDASVFPLVVLAVGNPHERLFWKVRRPDGQYYYKGFETAAEADRFAAGIKAGTVSCMTEFEYRAAGGYVGIWLGSGPRPALHRQQTEEQYLSNWLTKHRALDEAANFVHSVERSQIKTIRCFDGNNHNSAMAAAAAGALYIIGQYKAGDDKKRDCLLKAANAAAKCIDSRARLTFCL